MTDAESFRDLLFGFGSTGVFVPVHPVPTTLLKKVIH